MTSLQMRDTLKGKESLNKQIRIKRMNLPASLRPLC